MFRFSLRFVLLVLAMFVVSAAKAAEPPASSEPEKLPPPRQEPRPVAPVVEMYPSFYRVNRYDVWQMYAVDANGYFRPRVAYSPYGSYYLYNGKPYLYGVTRQTDFAPAALGTPYRPAPAFMPYCPRD